MWNGFHLRCAHPLRSVFMGINDQSLMLQLTPGQARSSEPWQDVTIEQCGFDLHVAYRQFCLRDLHFQQHPPVAVPDDPVQYLF